MSQSDEREGNRSRRRRVRTIFGRGTRAISIGNSAGDLLIPLLFTPAPKEANDNHGHVITAHATCLGVGGQAVVHHVFADFIQILLGSDASSDKFDDGL